MALAQDRQANLIEVALDAAVPASRVLDSAVRLQDSQEPASRLKTSTLKVYASRQLQAVLDCETPYGTVGKKMTIGEGDAALEVDYICPFALLNRLSIMSDTFGPFLRECLQGRRGTIGFYMDEVVPRNQLRPEKARTYQAIYWSLLQFPNWFRTRENAIGWFTILSS